MLILNHQLNIEIWSALMILSTQWYILFNVCRHNGASKGYRYTCQLMQIRGWLWWRRFLLPGIMPTDTGLMTAVGGAWNASILAEALTWEDKTLCAWFGLIYNLCQHPWPNCRPIGWHHCDVWLCFGH